MHMGNKFVRITGALNQECVLKDVFNLLKDKMDKYNYKLKIEEETGTIKYYVDKNELIKIVENERDITFVYLSISEELDSIKNIL